MLSVCKDWSIGFSKETTLGVTVQRMMRLKALAFALFEAADIRPSLKSNTPSSLPEPFDLLSST